jgi:hypothetical protein
MSSIIIIKKFRALHLELKKIYLIIQFMSFTIELTERKGISLELTSFLDSNGNKWLKPLSIYQKSF